MADKFDAQIDKIIANTKEKMLAVVKNSIQDKFDAINVDKAAEIPCDYFGLMGVPITFFDKFNPEQFEIVGLGAGELGREIGIGDLLTDEELIKFKKMSPAFRRGIPFYFETPTSIKVPYARIFIKRRT